MDPRLNESLASLSPGDFDCLRPYMRTVDLIFDAVLAEAGAPLAGRHDFLEPTAAPIAAMAMRRSSARTGTTILRFSDSA